MKNENFPRMVEMERPARLFPRHDRAVFLRAFYGGDKKITKPPNPIKVKHKSSSRRANRK
jgi:hypothetical protein